MGVVCSFIGKIRYVGQIMRRLLVVEDDSEDIYYITSILESKYEICVTDVAHEAIRLACENTYDCILIDVYLKGIDGFETLRIIKTGVKDFDTPVIVMSGVRDNSIELECIELGVADILTKPFNQELVLSKVRKVIEDHIYKTSLKEKIEKTQYKMEHIVNESKIDELTGLYNRSGGLGLLNDMLYEYENITIFMIDIDNFKRINDTFGHVAGDDALATFGRIISNYLNKTDIAIRIGGDEFLIGISERLTEVRIGEIVGYLNKKCIEKFEEMGYRDIATVSVGVVRYPEDAECVDELYRKADKALYTVKVNGKNGVHLYDEFIDESNREGNVDSKKVKYTVEGHLDTRDGAYQVEYNDFKKIYNFVCRYCDRYEGNAKMVIFTLGKSQVIDLDTLKKAMNSLESAANSILRRSDVTTKYNCSQYLVLLMNIKNEDVARVVDRVIREYDRYVMGEKIELSYDIELLQESEG